MRSSHERPISCTSLLRVAASSSGGACMRGLVFVLALSAIVALGTPRTVSASNASAGATISASTSYDLQEPQSPVKDVNVDINVNRGGGVAWYRSPIWIAIAVIGGVVILLLIVLVAR